MELKAEYKRETYRNYVIVENQKENGEKDSIQEERYEIRMLRHNKIPYLLDIQTSALNEVIKYAYDITGKQVVSDWMERRTLNYKDCEQLYRSMFNAIDICAEYLLDEKNLVFSPEFIYFELGSNKYSFLYYIYYGEDILGQMNRMSEALMDAVDYEEERAVLLVYAMYHESRKKEASIDTLRAVFYEKTTANPSNKEKEDTVELTRKQLVPRPIMEVRQEDEKLVSKYSMQSYFVVGATAVVMLIVIIYSVIQGLELKKLAAVVLIMASLTAYISSKMFAKERKIEKLVPVVEYIKQPEIGGEYYQENPLEKKVTIEIEDYQKEEFDDKRDRTEDLYECTQLLSILTECSSVEVDEEVYNASNRKATALTYALIPKENTYKKLRIQEFPFYIGKMTEGMDAVIEESTISRIHAKITQEEKEFYITDMGSTNGTFVNEENIQPHSKMLIKTGDVLRFASISYVFELWN
ncbi:DUF6382 domain-containing protein [Anaerosporobacter sp.]|uniref:DUF6382 domain-containing protein n=1 Tax=Anaerosporobacter sp. TaxID=1872529 RepID=UPI00286EDAC2|nr:DUF6382 domain-containing protein [Anaerosporobacter sp.]